MEIYTKAILSLSFIMSITARLDSTQLYPDPQGYPFPAFYISGWRSGIHEHGTVMIVIQQQPSQSSNQTILPNLV